MNNYCTSPPKILQKSNSVNYIDNFKLSMSRPLLGMPLSSSTNNLKKTSLMRCKTAIQRKPSTNFISRKQLNSNNTLM